MSKNERITKILRNITDDDDWRLLAAICGYPNDAQFEESTSFSKAEVLEKTINDNYKSIVVDKKDGDYTLKKVNITDTYVEVQIELPFQTSLGNSHNNFIIVHDDKGRELNMSNGIDGKNKIYTQINELAEIGQMPKYIDIFVCTNYAQEENALSTFRVNID